MLIYIELEAIYLKSLEIDTLTHDSYELVFYINKRVKYWIKDDLLRVNFIVIDIESKMRVIWVELQKLEGWEHMLYVLCDSHEIQLLMFHTIENIAWFTAIFKRA